MKILILLIIIILIAWYLPALVCGQEAFVTEASYYTRASCIAESGQCVMANGKELQDETRIAASWDYPLGTLLKISLINNKNRSVIVRVTDRGPAKRLYRAGRRIDLSKGAFEKLALLHKGIIRVKVEKWQK